MERTWTGGQSPNWNDASHWEPEGVPEADDIVVIPSNATLKLVSSDVASWAVANRLDYLKPLCDTSWLEVEVTSGVASLACGVNRGYTDWRNRNSGGIVKTGSGELHLTKKGQHSYYTSIKVSEGALRLPDDIPNEANIFHDKLHVEKGASLYLANGENAAAVQSPSTIVQGLSGEGLVTNTISSVWGCVFVVEGAATNEFAGTIGGRMRMYSSARMSFTGADSTVTGLYFYVCNNAGRGAEGPNVSFAKLGMSGEPSSIGASPILFGNYADYDASGYIRYLGEGETSDKSITFTGTTAYPSCFDAGAHGGLELTGAWGLGSSAMQDYTFVLTGSNTVECAISGPINDKTSGGYAITNIVKRGSGIWRFADVARGWSGALTVEEGTLRYDSFAPKGTACALGTAENAAPHPIILKGGTFEYTGASPLDAAGRTVAIDGIATLRNASGKRFRLDGVTASASGSTLVLAGDAGNTNVVSGVTGPLSVRKTGDGTWTLDGEQSFAGDIVVEGGDLLVTRPKYEYYRLWFRHSVSNIMMFYVGEIGLYSKDGARQNAGMSIVEGGILTTADTLEPNQAGASRWYATGDSYGAPSGLFDDTTSGLETYQRINGTNTKLDPDNESTWFGVTMRLGVDAMPVESYDIVVGASYNANRRQRSVDDYLLQGSVDGIAWDDLSATNGYKQIGANQQWFFGGGEYKAGDAVRHSTGLAIRARPESRPALLENVGYVTVAPGATLKALVDDVAISKVRVAASGHGTIDNFRLAAEGVLDITEVDRDVREIEISGLFANISAADVENLSRWDVTVNGGEPSRWVKTVAADGTVRLAKAGMLMIIR